MSYRTACALYLAGVALGIVALIAELDDLLGPITLMVTAIGLALTLRLVLEREFYIVIWFVSHLAMYVFTLHAYLNVDRVCLVPEFDFSVFTTENLRSAMLALTLTTGVIATMCLLRGRQSSCAYGFDFRNLLQELLGKIAALRADQVLGLVAMSFLSALVLFMSGTSVLEVPYPFNNTGLPYPADLLKIPSILGALAVGAVHAQMLGRRPSFRNPLALLYVARANFLVSSLLTLLILGARGFNTFACVAITGLEFYSARKRRVIPLWGLIFLFSAYFLYAAWPFLRAELSSMDTGAAVRTSIERALNSGEDITTGSQDLIDLGSYPMVGQSLFHLLYVIQLEDQGTSLAGSTFVNLIPQALPSFLDGVLWERPLNDNWKLAERYVHGGGFLVIANAYWNGGMVVMLAFVACFSAMFLYFDHHMTKPRTGSIYKVVYFALIPIITVQIFYGIQGLAKPLEVLALVIAAEKWMGLKKNRLEQPAPQDESI